jgi:hypothetical protein
LHPLNVDHPVQAYRASLYSAATSVGSLVVNNERQGTRSRFDQHQIGVETRVRLDTIDVSLERPMLKFIVILGSISLSLLLTVQDVKSQQYSAPSKMSGDGGQCPQGTCAKDGTSFAIHVRFCSKANCLHNRFKDNAGNRPK